MGKNSPKKTRITIADVGRSARKLQEEKDGLIEISDASAPTIRKIATGFEEQYKEDKRRAGSVSKKKNGIWLATCELRSEDPEMSADAIWQNLHNRTVDDRWNLELDGERIIQMDMDTEKTESIKFNTFKRHYFSEVLKK